MGCLLLLYRGDLVYLLPASNVLMFQANQTTDFDFYYQ